MYTPSVRDHDYADAAQALRHTLSTLETAGIPAHVLAAILLSAAIETWRRCSPEERISDDDVRELVSRVARS